jgi:hypothetical protein
MAESVSHRNEVLIETQMSELLHTCMSLNTAMCTVALDFRLLLEVLIQIGN